MPELPEMRALLEVQGLRAGYGAGEVLHGIDFSVAPGGVTALLGANGAGKTTTLRAVCGLLRRAGAISFDGARIDAAATEDIARRGVAHVPEGRGTFLELSVSENLRLGAYMRRDRGVAADIARMLDHFPQLAPRLRQQAGTLSGGEQQMLAIARALLARPKLLLLDEPSFGLAPLIVQQIFAILRAIRTDSGIGILLVEQDASLALALADQACILDAGRVALAGPAATVGRDEQVRRVYLGY
jgi:branched-chain amino acid transport system ATP-binding protein